MKIFPNPNRDSYSVKNSESHDMKILIEFPENPALEILIKNCNCVGSTYTRGCFFLRIGYFTIYNRPVILGCFLV